MNLAKGRVTALKTTVLLAACVGALTSCERQGTGQQLNTVEPDLRVVKRFGKDGSRFCTVPLIYSEANEAGTAQTVRSQIVVTGANQSATTLALVQACAGLSLAGKIQCSQELQDNKYPCIHESMFVPKDAVRGDWQCRMVYSVPTEAVTPATSGAERSAIEAASEKLLLVTGKPGEPVQQAIDQAFSQCAEIKGEQTESIRNACATAMIEEKMTCTNLSPPVPPPAKINLTRKKRH